MIMTQIGLCPSPGHWRFLRSSMTKWTMSKQPSYVLQIESRPRMGFLSCMYRLQVRIKIMPSHTLNVVMFYSMLYLRPWINSKWFIYT